MLGSAGEKISRVVELAETLYDRTVELREEVQALQETTRDTRDRVAALEGEVAEQGALLDALAEAEGLDAEAVRTAAADETADESSGEPAETASGADR